VPGSDYKNEHWRDSEQAQYLRPATLFGPKLPGYLQSATKWDSAGRPERVNGKWETKAAGNFRVLILTARKFRVPRMTLNKYCQALAALRSQPAHELKEVGDQWRTPDLLFWGSTRYLVH
jgi:hypothetical protein